MAHTTPLSRRRPRSIVVGITYVALGIIIGTAITFGVRGDSHAAALLHDIRVSARCSSYSGALWGSSL